MQNSLRKSFRYRLRKKPHTDDHVYPRIDANDCSNSKLNLVKPVKSKSFLQRRRRRHRSSSSSPLSPLSSSEQAKSKVFEPRYDIHYNSDDDPFPSSINPHSRPFDRLTYQIRKSFRNTLRRQRPRFGSTNSNNHLILNKNDENQILNPILYPKLSTGLTSPLTITNDNDKKQFQKKQRKAPLAPTHMNQSISLPIEINVKNQQTGSISSNDRQLDNNAQNLKKTNFNQLFRINFSFLQKKHQENQQHENPNEKLTFRQRFDSLRRSFHIVNRNVSKKHNNHLLSNE
ncbi:unnamed protein product [Rotaria sp. Silwood2]|nr:unnamed protein product [Rotaria sp. Silwood2]CAF3224147.1 unnamed protein product [Rotaria sp. Silwood2]CAF3313418.1 unnamed protein product [Rotaria sp. Silwood2]CAF3366454.1 unnamed protein product [Rotaria sp. Silwood2]CAF4267050.1 unnamed protein product [Rotaria sp. Silwood2]